MAQLICGSACAPSRVRQIMRPFNHRRIRGRASPSLLSIGCSDDGDLAWPITAPISGQSSSPKHHRDQPKELEQPVAAIAPGARLESAQVSSPEGWVQ
eukprot:Skav229993  [mRNA]  locus=scaffold17:17968:19334:+ [translate_table: standard]